MSCGAAAADRSAALLVRRRDRAGVGHSGAAGRTAKPIPDAAPPVIAPLLVSVVIVPEFDTPAPPLTLVKSRLAEPPVIAPLLFSVVIVPVFAIPAPPTAACADGMRRGCRFRR